MKLQHTFLWRSLEVLGRTRGGTSHATTKMQAHISHTLTHNTQSTRTMKIHVHATREDLLRGGKGLFLQRKMFVCSQTRTKSIMCNVILFDEPLHATAKLPFPFPHKCCFSLNKHKNTTEENTRAKTVTPHQWPLASQQCTAHNCVQILLHLMT